MRQFCTPRAQPFLAPEQLCALTLDPMALSSAGSPSSDSCPGLSNGEEVGLEKPSLEPRKSLGEEGLQRGPDALGPASREDEEEDEEEEYEEYEEYDEDELDLGSDEEYEENDDEYEDVE